MIAIARARDLINAFRRQKVLVVGDLMLDRYLYGSVERISPEAPVPVVRTTREKRMPGGAANTAANIRALGGQVTIAGVIGDDAAGAELFDALKTGGIGTTGVLRQPGFSTIVKMRIVAERQQVVRVDWEGAPLADGATRRRLVERTARMTARATGVVLSDYGKGMVDQAMVDAVMAAAHRARCPVGMDPKDTHHLTIKGITVATPNCREAHVCAGLPARASIPGNPLRDSVLRKAGNLLLAKWRAEQLVITLGAQGMYLVARNCKPEVIPTRAREVFDVSGAGDTVIATCLLALAAGADRREAAMLGNYAAGVVVGKLGTACCTPEELMDAIRCDQGPGATR